MKRYIALLTLSLTSYAYASTTCTMHEDEISGTGNYNVTFGDDCFTNIQNQIDANTIDITSNTAHNKQHAAELSKNITDIANNAANIADNNNKVTKNIASINALSSNITTNQTGIKTNSDNIASNTTEISNNNGDISKNANDIIDINQNHLTSAKTQDLVTNKINDFSQKTLPDTMDNFLAKIPDIMEIKYDNCQSKSVYLATVAGSSTIVQSSNYLPVDTSHPSFIVISQQNNDDSMPHGVSISIGNLTDPTQNNKMVITRQGAVIGNWDGKNIPNYNTPGGKFVLMNRTIRPTTDKLSTVDGAALVTVKPADSTNPWGYVQVHCN